MEIRVSQFFRTLYQRAMIMGAVLPSNERWKLYLLALATPTLAAIPITNMLLDPDQSDWRSFLDWGLVGMCTFFMPFVLIMIYSHHHPEKTDPTMIDARYRSAFHLGRSMKIGLIAAATLPPLMRLILGAFGWDF